MFPRIALVAGAAGAVAAALVVRRRRRRPAVEPSADPAAELRRKLDESRALGEERDEFEAGETTVDRAEPVADTVDERRRRVHEQAQAAASEMSSGDADTDAAV